MFICNSAIDLFLVEFYNFHFQFNEEEMHNYRMAVTEREVRNGCITMPDDYVKDHVIIYTRILKNINMQNLKESVNLCII